MQVNNGTVQGTLKVLGKVTSPLFEGTATNATNAETATVLKTARTISLTGDVTGNASFNGSANVAITATVVDDSHNHSISTITNLQTTLNGKANASHTHSLGNISSGTLAVSGGATGTVTLSGISTITIPITSLDASKLSGTLSLSTTGNAATATKLATSRTIYLNGDVTGSVSFDGTADAIIATTVVDDSHNHTISTITNLQTTLDSKANSASLSTVATSGSYNDLLNKPTIPSAYTLPTASSSVLGGIKVGSNLSISNGVLSTSFSEATTTTSGLMSSNDKTKLNGIATGAEVNQNAFSSIAFVSPEQTALYSNWTVIDNGTMYTISQYNGGTGTTINVPSSVTLDSTPITATEESSTFYLAAGSNIVLSKNIESKTIAISSTASTYADVTTTTNGLMIATDKVKLDGIATGAEVNQNAFSNIVVGSDTITASSKTDTFSLTSGTGISLSANTTDKIVTVSNALTAGSGLTLTNGQFALTTEYQNLLSENLLLRVLSYGAKALVSALPTTGMATYDSYLLSTTKQIAVYYNSAWVYFTPQIGYKVYVQNVNKYYKYTTTAWIEVSYNEIIVTSSASAIIGPFSHEIPCDTKMNILVFVQGVKQYDWSTCNSSGTVLTSGTTTYIKFSNTVASGYTVELNCVG